MELFSFNIQHKGYFCHCCCKTFALNIFQRSWSFCSNNKELFFMIGTISFFCVILGGITRGVAVELLLVLNWIPISWPWCQGVLELERWTSTNFRRTTSRLLVDICAFQPCKRVLGRIFIVSQFHHHFVRGTATASQLSSGAMMSRQPFDGGHCWLVSCRNNPSSPFVMTR